MSLFELRGVSRSFGGLRVADNVSLALAPGERAALIGPNGAGKTTLVNLAAGQLSADLGQVVLEGRDVTGWSPARRARSGLVRTFQVARLFPELSVADHLGLAVTQRLGRAGRMLADHRAMPDVSAEVAGLLDLLGLATLAGQAVGTIAYGQQRLLDLGMALALQPRVLLLDEPAAGLAGADTQLIEAALARLPPDLAVLMIEHDIGLVFRFARRVIVLAAGRVIFDGPADLAAADPAVREAYLGDHADARRST